MFEDVPNLVLNYFETKTTYKLIEEKKGIYKIIPKKASPLKSPKQKSPR